MTDARPAWVMDVGDGLTVAAGTTHVAEYLLAADPSPLPRTPAHCAGLMLWRDRLIPVIDLARLLTGRRGAQRRAVVLAYQQAPGRPLEYGALYVAGAPVQTAVSDDMACALPDAQPALAQIARACFAFHERAVPIIDPGALFTRPLPAAPAPPEETARAAPEPVPATRTAGMVARRDRPAAEVVPIAAATVKRSEPPQPAPAAPAWLEPVAAPVDEPATAAINLEAIDIEWSGDIAGDGATPGSGVSPPAPLPATARTDDPATATAAAARAAARAAIPSHDAPGRRASTAARSFERLHAIERRHNRRVPRGWRWLAAVLAAVLLLLGIWELRRPEPAAAPAAADEPPAAARDGASLEVRPVLVPSTPAQPPD